MREYANTQLMIKKLLLLLLAFYISLPVHAQHFFLPLSNEAMQKFDPWLNRVDATTHTSVKPYLSKDLYRDTPYDSLTNVTLKDKPFNHTWLGRKLFSEHLLQVKDDDVVIHLDPAFELSGGRDLAADSNGNFTMNQRGVYLEGTIGAGFSFNASFYENLGHFAGYLDSVVKDKKIVPGQGRIKTKLSHSNFDYAVATGTISYQLKKHFTFQFGHDRNFIGDGYRSLLLSDNTYPYPFLKIITDFWKIRYVNIFAVMQDLEIMDDNKWNDQKAFDRKYGSFHYLDINIGRHATVGLFEAVIWKSDSVTGRRGFDINYLNPFVFLRPIEYGIGSPDNVLVGLNAKIKLNSSNQLYGQIMLDEFLLNNVKSGTGWWGNKQGLLGGFKSFNVFGVSNLHVQSEISYVRPYTYEHREPLGNYGHYRQPLAHPLGANFIESVNFIYYTWRRFDAKARFSYVLTGFDTDSVNYGQNIFLSYENNRPRDFNNRVGQGLRTTITISQLTLAYVINPSYNMRFFIDVMARRSENKNQTLNTLAVQAGIKTYLFNRYYDF
jgi:hypothetical protein